MADAEIIGGFNRPRPTEDPYVAGQYEQLGLSEAPSLQDIEPHAVDMMASGRVLEGMGLVLGRRVDAADAKEDPDLKAIVVTALSDPRQAFGGLLMKLELDRLEAEGQA